MESLLVAGGGGVVCSAALVAVYLINIVRD